MDQQVKSIDVEAIMKEIRQQIAQRGETEAVLDFDEVTVDRECPEGISASVRYDDKALHHLLASANAEHNIPYYQMIPKGGMKSFVKRSIRKVIAFVVQPLRDAQNRYNFNVVHALMQLEAYTLEQEGHTAYREQDERFARQEEDIERLTQRIQKLEKRCELLLNDRNHGESL